LSSAALKHDLEHAGLGVVELHQASEQVRAYLGNRGPHRMAELAVDVPEHDRIGARRPCDTELVDARLQLVVHYAGFGKAGEVAFHVGNEHRHTEFRETFGEQHQRHRFAGAGRAGDHAVAIRMLGQQINFFVAFADQDVIHSFVDRPSDSPM
jgi:hypothetical protein